MKSTIEREVNRVPKYSLKCLLAATGAVCIVFALWRVLFAPTPQAIMQQAAVGIGRVTQGPDRYATIFVTDGTSLTPKTIEAIVAFDQEWEIHKVSFRQREIAEMELRLMARLEHVDAVGVRHAPRVAPNFLSDMRSKANLQRCVFYDSNLTGLVFPNDLPLSELFLDDSIISDAQTGAFETYLDLKRFSANRTSLNRIADRLAKLTKLEHVTLLEMDVPPAGVARLCELPELKWVEVTDSEAMRPLLKTTGRNPKTGLKLILRNPRWTLVTPDV